jgi:hypothetical protein
MQKFMIGLACACVFVSGVAFCQTTRLSGSRGSRTSSLGRGGAGASAGVSTGTGAAGAEGHSKNRVRISRFPQPNKASMVKTPEYNVNVQNTQNKVSSRPRNWALFEIKYETAARWTDELTFTYHVMAKGLDDNQKEVYSYYTLTERYVDIPRGEHMSCVALPPSLVERYGQPISLALLVKDKDGTILAQEQASTIPYPSKEWWDDPKVMDRPMVVRRAGLLDRSKTPFALINTDDYEVIQ